MSAMLIAIVLVGSWSHEVGESSPRAYAGSIILRSCVHHWGTFMYEPADRDLIRDKKRTVDGRFSNGLSLERDYKAPWEVFGKGPEIRFHGDDIYAAEIHKDKWGTRLISVEGPHFSIQTIILSGVSRNAGRLIRSDLRRVKTNHGIHLGTSVARLRRALGHPSVSYRFEGYQIYWYFGRPKRFDKERPYVGASCCAYATKDGRIREIELHVWSNEPVG